MIASWRWDNKTRALTDSLRIARIQQKLGLEVCINANACMYGFFNGDEATAHIDDQGNPFFDPSIPGKIGCPFRINHRYEAMREQIDYFVRAYKQAALPIDFVFGDWEIDGPLEVNRAWETAKRCVVCREHIPNIERFEAFQKVVRLKRSEVTRLCYAQPILSRYPQALVGNYAVYPHDGYRYWLDYFETFFAGHPHRMDQRAPCRKWYDDFPITDYTFAMPVYYTWGRIFGWYDFENTDYRWFYNMLRVASNAGEHTDPCIPIIAFVHWHTVDPPDESTSMSEWAYKEFLWHALLRGTDTFFMWAPAQQYAKETDLVHQVWSEALTYADWLNEGAPIIFHVPSSQGPVVSGLRRGDRVLVRRTDFNDNDTSPFTIMVDQLSCAVPRADGRCQILQLE